ncbi:MAG TPA: ChbG/HpnK family deacetylase [Gemmatimonadaceae bacterium]|nr:ChbG/HpnK family deacetylase [Gemmatimonadaceae bacterium]
MPGAAATAERPPARLVINADDFGLSDGVNRGILEAFEAGALRSASVMVGMPAFAEAARAARAAGDALGTGLHFTLTNGRPLTRCPSLVDASTGEFVSIRRLALRALSGRVQRREVEAECDAQIARCRAAGLRITHLDGHQHAHALPVIRDAVWHVVQRERIPYWRRPAEPLWGTAAGMRRLPERLAIAFLASQLPAKPPTPTPSPPQPRTADHFAGTALLGAPRATDVLLRLLDTLAAGTTELMVHPGYVPGPLPGGDTYREGREQELRALTSAPVLARLHRGDIVLTHFGSLCIGT